MLEGIPSKRCFLEDVNDFLDFLPTIIPIIDVRRQGGDKRAPRDSQSNSPIVLHSRAMVVNPFAEILSRPQSNCADKAFPGSEPVDHLPESLLGPSKTFFLNFYSIAGKKLVVSSTPSPEKNSSVYRLSKPPRYCFVVGPVKKHTVTTPLPPSGRWWESALYPDYYSVERILQTTNPMKGLGCRPGCGQRMDLSMLGARYRDP